MYLALWREAGTRRAWEGFHVQEDECELHLVEAIVDLPSPSTQKWAYREGMPTFQILSRRPSPQMSDVSWTLGAHRLQQMLRLQAYCITQDA